jgi:hypothetical protein
VCRDVRGVAPAAVEVPIGKADSARPPSRDYMPERVAWQDAGTGRVRRAPRKSPARAWPLIAAAAAGGGAAVAWVASRWGKKPQTTPRSRRRP